MEISLTGRHVEITSALRSHIDKKLEKLASQDDIIDVRVVLSVEKHGQFAEITITGRGNAKFHSREETDDMYASFDKAASKIERQVKEHMSKKRRTQRHKEKIVQKLDESSAAGPSNQAAPQKTPTESHGEFRVSISDDFPPKPMSVEEALMQLEASGDDFQAFVNEETDEVNVVYTDPKGGYGLLRRTF